MMMLLQLYFFFILLTFCRREALALSQSGERSNRRSFLLSSGAALVSSQCFDVLNRPVASAALDPLLGPPPSVSSSDYVGPYSIPKSFSQEGSWQPPPETVTTKLGKDRILAQELSPLQQFSLPFGSSQETYYPSFLFGAWTVKATLKRKIYPYGATFVPFPSLLEGSPRNRNEKVGDTTEYEVHYFSTLANTASNQLTVNLGLGVPQTKIIADRAFNAISLSKAYKQLTPVQEVIWDYSKDPTQYSVKFGAGALADDMRPLGPRRGEVYLTARATEDGNNKAYCAVERSRSVTLATGSVVVSDMESITEFQQQNDDHVTAISRIAVYLTPNPNSREGVLWQQINGKAVAFFDYELDLTRQKESFLLDNGSSIERPCVRTPKDVVQCG